MTRIPHLEFIMEYRGWNIFKEARLTYGYRYFVKKPEEGSMPHGPIASMRDARIYIDNIEGIPDERWLRT